MNKIAIKRSDLLFLAFVVIVLVTLWALSPEVAGMALMPVGIVGVRELRDRRAKVLEQMEALVATAEVADRDLTEEESRQWDQYLNESTSLESRISRLEALPEELPAPSNGRGRRESGRRAPSFNRIPRGDDEIRALAHYVRSGDQGAVRDLMDDGDESSRSGEFSGPAVRLHVPTGLEMRAVDSTMNITTAADGGATVPTGFAGAIAMRRNEIRLAERLGVRMVPGVGTTVNYPYENADPSVFAATSEQSDAHGNNYERDVTPVVANKAFTLAKKSKKVELTEELLDDEDVNLMTYVADTIGRAIGMTNNSLLLTEVAANGTSLKTFASATAVAAGEAEDIVYHDVLSFYENDADPLSWVMRPTTFGAWKSITGNARLYEETPGGSRGRSLLEYPVHYSNYATAIQASAKSNYFGNWYFVGMREDPALRFIRDPYSVDGLVVLKYSFRTVYGVLIAGAVGYGVHPSA